MVSHSCPEYLPSHPALTLTSALTHLTSPLPGWLMQTFFWGLWSMAVITGVCDEFLEGAKQNTDFRVSRSRVQVPFRPINCLEDCGQSV